MKKHARSAAAAATLLFALCLPACMGPEDIVTSKLNKVVITLDPFKVALAMYFHENESFPDKQGTVYPADAGKPLPPDSVWSRLGFSVSPQLPAEIASIAYVPSRTGKDGALSFGLIIKLTNTREDGVNGVLIGLSPTDDLTITSDTRATFGGKKIPSDASSLSWFYSCHHPAGKPVDSRVLKRFANSGVPLECH